MGKGKGILLNDNYDVQINVQRDVNGEIVQGFTVGDVLYQNQAVILQVQPCEIKSKPQIGIGISDCLLDNDFLKWRQRVAEHLELDDQTITDVQFDINKKLKIDGGYSR
jgi:hypothetical protein